MISFLHFVLSVCYNYTLTCVVPDGNTCAFINEKRHLIATYKDTYHENGSILHCEAKLNSPKLIAEEKHVYIFSMRTPCIDCISIVNKYKNIKGLIIFSFHIDTETIEYCNKRNIFILSFPFLFKTKLEDFFFENIEKKYMPNYHLEMLVDDVYNNIPLKNIQEIMRNNRRIRVNYRKEKLFLFMKRMDINPTHINEKLSYFCGEYEKYLINFNGTPEIIPKRAYTIKNKDEILFQKRKKREEKIFFKNESLKKDIYYKVDYNNNNFETNKNKNKNRENLNKNDKNLFKLNENMNMEIETNNDFINQSIDIINYFEEENLNMENNMRKKRKEEIIEIDD